MVWSYCGSSIRWAVSYQQASYLTWKPCCLVPQMHLSWSHTSGWVLKNWQHQSLHCQGYGKFFQMYETFWNSWQQTLLPSVDSTCCLYSVISCKLHRTIVWIPCHVYPQFYHKLELLLVSRSENIFNNQLLTQWSLLNWMSTLNGFVVCKGRQKFQKFRV